jgi:hypothetical protein
MDAMVIAAIQFDAFISGRMTERTDTNISRESQSEATVESEQTDLSVPHQED